MTFNKKIIIPIGIFIMLIVGYLIVDSLLFDGVKPKAIHENGFQANYFAKKDTKNKPAIILIGGGQWGEFWSQEFVRNGAVGLSLPYIRREGLPTLPEAINLEYFEKTINWLRKQPEVNPNKIIVMGASRNAELALIIAATFPEIVSGVVAYAPSSVSWANTVLSYNSDEQKPSWIYKGKDIPYVPMDKIKGSELENDQILNYWKKGLLKTEFVKHAAIPVEKINGPILLFSGNDDQVWPSTLMANQIEERLKRNNFKYAYQNIKYDNAGHLISTHPERNPPSRSGTMLIKDQEYSYLFGGTDEGDLKAKKDAQIKLITFIKAL